MDEQRFDDLTRAFAALRSRRGMVRVLAGGLLAAIGVRKDAPAVGKRRRQGGRDNDNRRRGKGNRDRIERDRDRDGRDRERNDRGHGGDETGAQGNKGNKGKGHGHGKGRGRGHGNGRGQGHGKGKDNGKNKNKNKDKDKNRNDPKRPPLHSCQSQTDCGACGACTVLGYCQAQDDLCSACQVCDPYTFTCANNCGDGKVCCDGFCQTAGPETCCTSSEQCGPEWGCLWCDGGHCAPVPDGRECEGCKRCQGGVCTVADDDLLCGGVCCPAGEVCVGVFVEECCPVAQACANNCCAADEQCGPDRECCKACGKACCNPDTHICRNPQNNDCCPKCENGQCCPGGQQCVDTGVLGSRFCCDIPCGQQADGTFSDCCDPGEMCIEGVCRVDCPDERPPCNGVCCSDTQRCCGPNGPCVEEGECCPGETTCGETCCPQGVPCTADGCCPPGATRLACGNRCVNPQTDINNCGACGNSCGACGACVNGTCVSLCDPGFSCCDGVCCADGSCCGRGTLAESCCSAAQGLCCTGGTEPGFEATCCFTEPNLHFCKVGPEGPNGRRAICSSNP